MRGGDARGGGELPDGASAARSRRRERERSRSRSVLRGERPFHPRLPTTRARAPRSSTTVRLAVARTSENTGVYLSSGVAPPFIFTSKAVKERRGAAPVVIVRQEAMVTRRRQLSGIKRSYHSSCGHDVASAQKQLLAFLRAFRRYALISRHHWRSFYVTPKTKASSLCCPSLCKTDKSLSTLLANLYHPCTKSELCKRDDI